MSKRNIYGNFQELGGLPSGIGAPTRITPYERLAVAIILQAFKDYNSALTPTPPGDRYKKVRKEKKRVRKNCESFFAGPWYEALTTLDPNIIISRAMTLKRKKTARRYAAILAKARRPERGSCLEDWQRAEIKRKRRHV